MADSFAFASTPSGGGGSLVPVSAAASRPGGLRYGAIIETPSPTVREVLAARGGKLSILGRFAAVAG